ncbi:Inactive TPR repeat-containing thioredoxin TTL3 [Cardamine amara subsp. amara]|uniref:Inactive TPR repeat-containing thioredoxin TTL3 n=1 Tax=Cardamine amara subsp. amara TaxID=228776 RepID=A0ABD1ABP6_CARAN
MAKSKKISVAPKLGCESLLGCIFQSWSPRRRKPSLPEKDHTAKDYLPPKSSTTITNPKTLPRKSTETSTQPKKSDTEKPQQKPKSDENNPRKSSESARKSISSASPRTESKRFSLNGVMGNIIVKPQPAINSDVEKPTSRWEGKTVNYRLDPEALKRMGNEEYCRGRFGEALAFYERAISADPKTPTYWSNKSAALISLGRLLEASDACEEALRLNPTYERAHQRLASLQLRLGEVEKALCHYNQAGKYTETKDIEQVEDVIKCLRRCEEARRSKEWNVVLKETYFAMSYGAESSPRVCALQTEALLHLQRHEEAYSVYEKGTKRFDIDCYIKIFGLSITSYLLMVGAQVYIAVGRFEDAVTASRQAARLDPSNEEVNEVARKSRAVASARLSGNLLFNASKFEVACVVYTEGLEKDPYNALLLCNRAASRFKLGMFEKAIEDCTMALNLQPSYRKARRRRADSNVKLEKWQHAIQDYELLMMETPEDEETRRALAEANVRFRKQTGGDDRFKGISSDIVEVN